MQENSDMGRNKFSRDEVIKIGRLLKLKNAGNRFQQKQVRHDLRTEFEFNISDFNEPGKAFGPDELIAAIQRGAIVILDDQTIADMKAKRAREAEAEKMAIETGEQTDWKQALDEWNEWENSQK